MNLKKKENNYIFINNCTLENEGLLTPVMLTPVLTAHLIFELHEHTNVARKTGTNFTIIVFNFPSTLHSTCGLTCTRLEGGPAQCTSNASC